MKVRLRRLVVLMVAALVIAGGGLVARNWWRQRSADLGRQVLDILPEVAQRMKDFHRVKIEGGRKVWEVAAREARYDDQQHVAVVQGPLASFFLPDGSMVGLQGREGKVWLGGRDLQKFEMSGAIEVAVSGYVMRTEMARYEREADSIVAPGAVDISGAQFDVRGDAMKIELAAQRLTLAGHVRMTLRPGA